MRGIGLYVVLAMATGSGRGSEEDGGGASISRYQFEKCGGLPASLPAFESTCHRGSPNFAWWPNDRLVYKGMDGSMKRVFLERRVGGLLYERQGPRVGLERQLGQRTGEVPGAE